MKKLALFGIGIVIVSLFINFQFSFTGFSVSETTRIINPLFLITFLLGMSLIFASGMDITGGLEKVLKNDTQGIVTFVRHGKKNDEGDLTEEGKEQSRTLGEKFKEIYAKKNIGDIYLYSSPVKRAFETVKEIMGVESKYKKPIFRDERLTADLEGDAIKEYRKVWDGGGKSAADNWYINSKYGEEIAENFANFLENKFKKVVKGGKKFHYIAGTHEIFTEALLKRVIIKDKGHVGFENIEEIGGTLNYAEPINFLLKEDGSYQVNLRNKTYDIDMKKLHKLSRNSKI